MIYRNENNVFMTSALMASLFGQGARNSIFRYFQIYFTFRRGCSSILNNKRSFAEVLIRIQQLNSCTASAKLKFDIPFQQISIYIADLKQRVDILKFDYSVLKLKRNKKKFFS